MAFGAVSYGNLRKFGFASSFSLREVCVEGNIRRGIRPTCHPERRAQPEVEPEGRCDSIGISLIWTHHTAAHRSGGYYSRLFAPSTIVLYKKRSHKPLWSVGTIYLLAIGQFAFVEPPPCSEDRGERIVSVTLIIDGKDRAIRKLDG